MSNETLSDVWKQQVSSVMAKITVNMDRLPLSHMSFQHLQKHFILFA